jgi:hypothetical protein
MSDNPLGDAPERETNIRERAYFLWEANGRPQGRSDEFWQRASDEAAVGKTGGGLLSRVLRNSAALFALGGAFIAAALPAAEFVRGIYELRAKEQEHADSVELEFLKLLTGDKIVQADRRQVLEVLMVVTSDSPLRGWAATQATRYDLEVAKRQKLAKEWQTAQAEADEKKRVWTLAGIDVESKQTELQELIDGHGDIARIEALQKELGPLMDRQDSAFSAWSQSADAAKATGQTLRTEPPPVVGVAPSTTATQIETASAKPQSLLPGQTTANSANSVGHDPITQITPDFLRQLFPQASLENITDNGPLLLHALTAAGLDDRDMLLVALATLAIEDPTLEANVEKQNRFNTKVTPFDVYDGRFGNTSAGDGARFRGRGFLLLTGRANYTTAARALNRPDLLTNPDSMAQPDVAARAYANFLGQRQARFREAASEGDLPTVRRLVNGGVSNLPAFERAWGLIAQKLDPAS